MRLLKFFLREGSMSPSLLQEDGYETLSAFFPLRLRVFLARCWRVGGVSLAMAIKIGFTSSPTQLSNSRGILCANRAPALVNELLAVI